MGGENSGPGHGADPCGRKAEEACGFARGVALHLVYAFIRFFPFARDSAARAGFGASSAAEPFARLCLSASMRSMIFAFGASAGYSVMSCPSTFC